MKIEGPSGNRPVTQTGRVSRTNKSSSTSGATFGDPMAGVEETSGISGTSSASGIMGIEQLVGLQEVDDALSQRRRANQHGGEILDRLDELRLQILEGRLSKERLMQLARVVSARRATVMDPHLIEILDEIDLRAQVEIAKFTRDQTTS